MIIEENHFFSMFYFQFDVLTGEDLIFLFLIRPDR